jgi:hypothetical protein
MRAFRSSQSDHAPSSIVESNALRLGSAMCFLVVSHQSTINASESGANCCQLK